MTFYIMISNLIFNTKKELLLISYTAKQFIIIWQKQTKMSIYELMKASY